MSGTASDAEVLAALRRATAERVAAEDPGSQGVRRQLGLQRDVFTTLRSAGPAIAALWDDAAVTDVLVNGPRDVWVDRGRGLERAAVDVGDVRALAVRLAAGAAQRLDDAAPVVDGRLPDGTRLHAVLPPIAAAGAVISLRRPRAQAVTLRGWFDGGGVDDLGLDVLHTAVSARANLLVSGATGSGKTTLLAALLGEVPERERIVVIEEARELSPEHPHVVHLQARAPNVEGAGAVGLDVLVRAAMRMRPDRLVLGECRGGEVREVLTALNTGHDGGMATVHANAAADVPARLVALGALARMNADTVAAQAISAIDAIVHLARIDGRRVVREIAVLIREPGGSLDAVVALARDRDGAMRAGPGMPHLGRRLERR